MALMNVTGVYRWCRGDLARCLHSSEFHLCAYGVKRVDTCRKDDVVVVRSSFTRGTPASIPVPCVDRLMGPGVSSVHGYDVHRLPVQRHTCGPSTPRDGVDTDAERPIRARSSHPDPLNPQA